MSQGKDLHWTALTIMAQDKQGLHWTAVTIMAKGLQWTPVTIMAKVCSGHQ
jgi:hypothetical protein